jgi:hypothetical protein
MANPAGESNESGACIDIRGRENSLVQSRHRGVFRMDSANLPNLRAALQTPAWQGWTN